MRNEELEAVGDVLKMLNDDDSRDLREECFGGGWFLLVGPGGEGGRFGVVAVKCGRAIAPSSGFFGLSFVCSWRRRDFVVR